MKSFSNSRTAGTAGFTVVEVLISMAIVITVMALTMTTFFYGTKMMYKDNQRLATNAKLRYFMAQISKRALDASEFYVFPSYLSLDGSVDPEADISPAEENKVDGTMLYHGDCVVLVTKSSLAQGSCIKQVQVYYRVVRDGTTDEEGTPIRYFAGEKQPDNNTFTLKELLAPIKLAEDPNLAGSTLLSERARGRPKYALDAVTGKPKLDDNGKFVLEGSYWPIFSSTVPSATVTNQTISINVEIINGTSENNLLSSSSFNYTISPRK